jgi:arginyl-tRNA--protein-N-Asp/Glu arginylyltransferase
MYDPKYSFLSPGVVGAVREIEYVNKIRKEYDDKMKYYFMGFYIQDCQKSVYKGIVYDLSYLE